MTETTNEIIGRWLSGKMRRLIRESIDAPSRGHWQHGPYGKAAMSMRKQGAGLGIALLTLFGRI